MAEPVRKSVTIHAPVSRVLEVVADLENTDRWADQAQSASVLARDDRGRPRRIRVTLRALGFTSTSTYTVSHTEDSMVLELADGGLVTESRIVYTAHDDGDGATRLDMSTSMEVGVPVPRWGLDRVVAGNMDKNLASIRNDAETTGPTHRRTSGPAG